MISESSFFFSFFFFFFLLLGVVVWHTRAILLLLSKTFNSSDSHTFLLILYSLKKSMNESKIHIMEQVEKEIVNMLKIL